MLYSVCAKPSGSNDKVPVVVVTDMYYPVQDPGDNFDILTPYSLPQIDLKGIIFDVTQEYRLGKDINGCYRDPGYIPVLQLNYIFNKNVRCACGPFSPMRTPDDRMEDIPIFEQAGFDLFFEILETSPVPVTVVSTGSCRFLAVAYNRNPKLMKKKISALHISAGSSSSVFKEWNIDLDETGAARLLELPLNIYLYPCATADGPFDLGENNTYWSIDDFSFVFDMHPSLKKYVIYTFLGNNRLDFLNILDFPLKEEDILKFKHLYVLGSEQKRYRHNVWEISLWQQVAGMSLVFYDDEWSLVQKDKIPINSFVYEESMCPVKLDVSETGLFSFSYVEKSNIKIYRRTDPESHQNALREAFPKLYVGYKP